MKCFCALLCFSFLFLQLAYSQNPLAKQWDKRYGGLQDEGLSAFQQTNEGGFILGGASYSGIGGDRTQPSWGPYDYWIVKLDSSGSKQWDKRFGGTNSDYLTSMQQTKDNGYILGGHSSSGISGDKTQLLMGVIDYWVVKIDSVGNKEWDKNFGGSNADLLYSVQQTSDKGYILGGWTISDSSGDVSQSSRGGCDYWIVKIDSVGTKQWDRRFGGDTTDLLSSIQQVNDGGYILGGTSLSGIGGDKTDSSQGGEDYWIVKIDSAGNKQWDRRFGGTLDDVLYSLKQTIDKGYVLGGLSASDLGGDKSQNNWNSSTDYWLVKIDSLGNKDWDKNFGGIANEDEYGNITQTSDKGYLLAGASYSPISGDKTDYNLGTEQTWVVKLDSLGNKQWDKTLHTLSNPDDEIGYALQISDGCYVFANSTNAGIGGDKTQFSQGLTDYWIVKFCDTTLISVSAFTGPSSVCPGTCTNFTNLSINANSYQWLFLGASPSTSNAINPQNICYNTPGSYDVTLIATNANGSDTLTLANYISVYPYPPPQGIQQIGDTLNANQGAVSYQWYFNGNIIVAATNYFYVAQASGDYNVVATDGNGCEVEAVVFNVLISVQSSSIEYLRVVEPNPFHENVKVFITGKITIFDLIGNRLLEKEISNTNEELDISFLKNGMYFLQLETGVKVIQKKLIKQ